MNSVSSELTVNGPQKRKKAIHFLLIFLFISPLIAFGVLSGCSPKKIKNIDSTGTSIVCFGDSITFGYGVPSEESYPAALAKMVDIPVINEGVDGDTTPKAILRLEKAVLSRNPKLVIVELGGNDFLRKISEKETIKNVNEIIDRIQAKGAMVALADISSGMLLKKYRKIYREIAHKKGAIFIPNILSGIITNPSLKSDFLHPNHAGYKIVARRIYLVISPYLHTKVKLAKK